MSTEPLLTWARRHGVSPQALAELGDLLLPPCNANIAHFGKTEAYTQSVVRLEGARKSVRLFRNNVGVLEDRDGRPVRYGLANDSKAMNAQVKSADLIGWRPRLITQEMVGTRIAQFLSRECKRPGWQYTGDEREVAQMNWAALVLADGGDAAFCTGEGTL